MHNQWRAGRTGGVVGTVVAILTSALMVPVGANASEAWDPFAIVESQGLLAAPGAEAFSPTDAGITATSEPTSIAPVNITPVSSEAAVDHGVASVTMDESQQFAFVTGTSAAGTNASFVVINDAAAPSSYQFAIEGSDRDVTISENPDGSLLILDGSGAFVNLIQAPWARDADGVSLPTSYSIEGNVVTQHVDLAGASFPVVADPQSGCGIGWCSIYFNRSETHDIATAGFIALGGAAAACSVGGAIAVAACAVAAASIGATAVYADNHGQCVGLSFWGVPPTIGWNPFIHDDEYC